MQEQEALYAACLAERELQWQVHIAGAGQSLDVSAGSSSFRVNISDQLLQQLNFRSMGNYSLAWLNANAQQGADQVGLPLQASYAEPLSFVSGCSLLRILHSLVPNYLIK